MFKNIIGTHKPDILDCISNLSSDEVFTPPSVVNQVLDLFPAEIWTNAQLKFLDPACKSGVFLREIAKRLMAGLEQEIPNEDARRQHIFRNMLYGISITELTGYLARRSLYYSKAADSDFSVIKFDGEQGNIHYSRGSHIYVKNKCKFCGAPEGSLDRGDQLENYAYQFIHSEKVFDMKFDVIVGNPPYQLEDDGYGNSSLPIFQHFVNQAISLEPKYLSMIIPARWYSGGKGLDDFRRQMIQDRKIKTLIDFPKLFDCFPGVEIKGGVCIFLRENGYHGNCLVKTVVEGEVISESVRDLRDGGDVLVRSNFGVPILKKVQAKKEQTLDSAVSSRKPFGLSTTDVGTDKPTTKDALVLYRRGGKGFISKGKITANIENIGKWKVYTAKAGDGHGRVPMIVSGEPIVGEPESVCSETYLVAGFFDTESEANNFAHFLRSKFCRFLISLRKNTQQVTKDVFGFIPVLSHRTKWTDKKLYERYGFDLNEIEHIESTIREMV
jgi:site-specific DNA-methyltransferase (adenine-specific)